MIKIDNWKMLNREDSGGQGAVYLVSYVGNDATVQKDKEYALKELKSQKDKERRERMYLEVVNLRILDHDAIPKVIETNVEMYKDLTQKLYFITEFISGDTLEQKIENTTCLYTEVVNGFIRLIEIVEYCHSKGVRHRDIKPDNIVCRNSRIDDLVLIDFGLSFNEDNSTNLTAIGQHVGNRFLFLPEFRSTTPMAKRDYRSDITMLCGIFFYMLTKEQPTSLVDENGCKPHQRTNPRETINKLSKTNHDMLNIIFDRGFSNSIDKRYQSLDALKNDVVKLLAADSDTSNSPSSELCLSAVVEMLFASDDIESASNLKKTFENCNNRLRTVVDSIIKSSKSALTWSQTNYNIDLRSNSFRNEYRLLPALGRTDISIAPVFHMFFDGYELISFFEENGEQIGLLRMPLLGYEEYLDDLEKAIQNYYIKRLKSYV